MRTYTVEIEYTARMLLTVEAASEKQAVKKALKLDYEDRSGGQPEEGEFKITKVGPVGE